MHFRKIFFTLLVTILLLSSCSRRNEVHLVSKNFESEVDQQQNLIFTFDKDLVGDSLTGQWDSIRYITFTPAVEGKFKWNSSRELLFSPLMGFKPSTDYTAEISRNITSRSTVPYTFSGKRTIPFHTQYLSMVSSKGFWTVSKSDPDAAALMVSVTFNYKVDPGTVEDHTNLYLNNEKVDYEMASTEVSNEMTLRIDHIKRDDIARVPLKIVVAKGLKCADEGNHVLDKDLIMDLEVPSPEDLAISSVTGEFEGTDAMMHIYTTQPVELKNLDQFLSIEPKTSFSTEATENGFYIKGNFSSGQNYTLEIKKNLKGLLGGTLAIDYKAQVSFGQMEPSIGFANTKGIYLSSLSSKNIAVNIVNIPKVHVTVYRVYENNIQDYLRNGRNNDYWYDEEGSNEGGFNYSTYDMRYFGDAVINRDYETKDLAKMNGIPLLNLSFEDKIPFKGIYIVDVASSTEAWRNATKLVSISDIGLIAKKSSDELHVFANSLMLAKGMSDVKISLISQNNQTVLTASTNSDGVAVFTNLKQRLGSFKESMITARSGNDFNYLVLADARVNDSRFDVGGRRANESGLMAFLYGDRDIYRPGETVHLNTIVRNEQWQSQQNVPVKVKVLLPNGREFKNMRGTLNNQGAFETSFMLPVSAVTGNYIAEVFTANDILLQSKNITVEEFMPDRIDVKLNVSKDALSMNDTMKVSLAAVNMFGPPAAGRRFEIQYNITRKSFSAKDFPGYFFDVKTDNKTSLSPNNVVEGKTDDRGKAEDIFAVKSEWKDEGQLNGKIFATVFDESGRPVNRVKQFDIYTQQIFFGMKLNDRYVDRGTSFTIPMIAVDKSGKPVAASAQVQVVRYDWYSAVEHDEYGGRYRWVSKKREVVLLDQTIHFSATPYAFNFIPRESGEYEVRIKDPSSERYTAEEFYSYGYGYTSNTSFEVNTEGQVDIKLDKEKYKPGDDATVVFTTPFNGKLLVTIEGDKLLDYRYLVTDKKSAMIKIPVKESFMPNVYITATLFRQLDDGSIPLTVGHGFIYMPVEKEGTRLPLTIIASEKSRSKTKQTIKIKTLAQQNIEVTISVVDEGILALKNYKTPDPHAFFYQKKALGVEAYDLYPNLLPDLKWNPSSTGGDGYDLEKRVNPLTNKRVQLVALWSGIMHTNASGEASYTIDIPQFSGDLRIMACAYKDKSFGSADMHMKVADPIVISAGIPRFLSPHDTLLMPVTLTNTTSRAADATAKISLTGPLKIAGDISKTVSLKANSEQRLYFKVSSGDVMDSGSITVNVNSMNENFSDKTEITVRPSTSLLKVSGSGELIGSRTLTLSHDFIPSTADAKLTISNSPMVQFSKALSYLVGYPYGCIEQTISKAFPQIYFSELVKNMKYAMETDLNPATNVQAAINKVQSMQQYDGGMSYWPGGTEETWWGTNYATHFLLESKKAGYEVNSAVIDKAMNFVAQQVKAHSYENYFYSIDPDFSSWRTKTIYKKENFYALYILALYAKADLSSMNYFKSNLDQVALDSRYMLACAYLAAGDRKSYEDLLPKSMSGEYSRTAFGGSFYSYLRDMAISLNALLETDPDNIQIPEMIRHLSIQLNKKDYINTQEAAFSFLALGKFMKRLNSDGKSTATVSAGGKTLATYNGKDITITKGIAGQTLGISVSGSSKLFYFYEIEGISAKGEYEEEDNYLQVRKSFTDRFGKPVDLKRIKQGDLIVVKVTLTNLEKSQVDNVVVTDMLPAGFEIENPRISEQQKMDWIKDQTDPVYFDVRDDRINFFTNLDAKPQHFYYIVRAVSLGNYKMGPVGADAMYNGEYHSYNGAGSVRVIE
jgi:uncharacterized repeat protein (TIGR01451 family)